MFVSIGRKRSLVALTAPLLFFGLFLQIATAQYSREPIGPSRSYESEAPLSAKTPRLPTRIPTPAGSFATPQSVPVYKTSGKNFIVAFASSVGNDDDNDLPFKKLYISARSMVHGTVKLVGGGWEQSFVTDPYKVTVVTLPAWAGLERNQTEQIYKRVFEVTTEDEVAVYALSHRSLSSDGFLVLPAEALGRQYSIASLRNALLYREDTVPRSEFLVVGNEDNTTVTITPSANSYGRKFLAGNPYSFILNKGEVIELTARDTGIKGLVGPVLYWVGKLPNLDCDMTGSIVTSDKPVAVFSGHERASTPDSLEYNWVGHPSVSRDHIIEQMPPTENWGKNFAFIPSSLGIGKGRPKDGDVIRVIAGYDLTDVFVEGKKVAQLSKGKFKEFKLKTASLITTTQPALVLKYLQTCMSIDTTGDPDMTVLPPIENMSTFYTLPSVAAGNIFSEHYICVLIDSQALTSTTINGNQLDPAYMYILPGSRYYYSLLKVASGSQRIESSLPCYAEGYGFGRFDSYSFSGGGSYEYLHSLAAVDLDFGMVPLGSAPDSITKVYSTATGALTTASEVYGYSWETGDTTVFAILDTLRSPITVAQNQKLPVHFRFTPPAIGSYSAVLRVWSNNKVPVFIKVVGTSAEPKIEVSSIDFGKVRVGRNKWDQFYIKNIDTFSNSALNLIFTDYSKLFLSGTAFTTIDPTVFSIDPLQLLYVDAQFKPTARQVYNTTFPVAAQGVSESPFVELKGEGVDYEIDSLATHFGIVKIGQDSFKDIAVTNLGNDTTGVFSVTLMVGADAADFELDSSTVPGATKWQLGVAGGGQDRMFYRARFKPRFDPGDLPFNKRLRTAIVKITTPDERPERREYFHALYGYGVEPYITVTNNNIDFGTFVNPTINNSVVLDTLINIGSYKGIINQLSQKNPTIFKVTSNGNPLPLDAPIAEGNALIPLEVTFNIIQTGDFYDTIFVNNDSRPQPLIAVHGVVRSGLDPTPALFLDTIQDCRPVDTNVKLHNPGKVAVRIDTITLAGQSGGFSIVDTNLLYPIFIGAGNDFDFGVHYTFPVDSLNGEQTVMLILHRPTFLQATSYEYDTIYISLIRHTKQLSLRATEPSYNPNALDRPFSIPVYLEGNRLGITELDNDTVKVYFSNDLIQPVGIDRTGSLTEGGKKGIPIQPNYKWDSIARVFSVPLDNVGLSHDSTANTLLFTILAKVYLESESVVEAATYFGHRNEPCAFRIASHLLPIVYADECGDRTIRDLLLDAKVPFSISDPHPNPATEMGVTVGYVTAKEYQLSWQVFDATGSKVLESLPFDVKGQGKVVIPTESIGASGLYYITFTVCDDASVVQKRLTTKFSLVK